MPTALQESSEDRFRAIFGSGRSTGSAPLSRGDGIVSPEQPHVISSDRVLLLNVAPAQPPGHRFFEPTPAGQSFRVLLLRQGEADFAGKVWNASAVIAFYLPDEDDNGNEPIRYIGTSTFLMYAGDDDGWFAMANAGRFSVDMQGIEYEPHYLDPASTAKVCAWLQGQSDAEALALHTRGNGDISS